MNMRLSASAVLALAAAAHAGFVIVGVDDSAEPTSAWAVDDQTGRATPLFDGFEIQGLDTDDANERLFFATDSGIYSWNYDGQTDP